MKVTTVFLIFTLVFGALIQANAQSKREPDSSLYRVPDSREDLQRAYTVSCAAAQIFREVMENPEDTIPLLLFDDAEMVAIFPSERKYGYKLEDGSGLLSIRDQQTGKFAPPIFVKIEKGDSRALHHECDKDLILLGMNLGIASDLLRERFKIDREVGAEPGPIGNLSTRPPGYSNVTGFISYLHTPESLLGICLSGRKIRIDDDLMKEVYGRDTFKHDKVKSLLPASQLISGRIMIFPETLDEFSMRGGM